MSDQRVSMFISHKVATHKRAAARIKTILESRTERLDVYICEEIPVGDRWREWITEHIAHSQLLLVLLPHSGAELAWIADEVARFESVCPTGRLVIVKLPSDPLPDILRDRQIVETSTDQLRERLLKPLFWNSTLTRLDVPLNRRVTEKDLDRDAQDIEAAMLGMADLRTERFEECLTVDTIGLDVAVAGELDEARVQAHDGCNDILNWSRRSFSWADLRARAEEEKGKGTFWISEMEQVIVDVARQNRPRVMTSTFRGRGTVAGRIFRPQLDRVDFDGDVPVRYRFNFHEVLAPELVRGQGQVGDVFNLLYIATRVRWEVLHPFLVNMALTNDESSSLLDTNREAQRELIGRVRTSLRVIEYEAERHNMIEGALNAFAAGDRDRERVIQLLRKREWIHGAIESAAGRGNFAQFMDTLAEGLAFNCEVTEILAGKFLQLVREDRQKVQQTLPHVVPKPVQPPVPAATAKRYAGM